MNRPPDVPPTGDEVDRAVAAAIAATGLHPSFTATVRQRLLAPDDQWRVCCGSGCDPCVELVARAVDEARSRLR